MNYFRHLSTGRTILWCYLIWYLYFVARYFDPSAALWLTSIGISAIVGIALLLSTWHPQARLFSWTTFRLFLMPFCVSSFSALIKGRGFTLVFSPSKYDNLIALALCAGFCGFVAMNKATAPKPALKDSAPDQPSASPPSS